MSPRQGNMLRDGEQERESAASTERLTMLRSPSASPGAAPFDENNPCPFVTGTYSEDEDQNMEVMRSTPGVAFSPSPVEHEDVKQSKSQVKFASLADDFPVATTGTALPLATQSCAQEAGGVNFFASPFHGRQSPARAETTQIEEIAQAEESQVLYKEGNLKGVTFVAASHRSSSPLCEEKVAADKVIRQQRRSPFQLHASSPLPLYSYDASKDDMDEMEEVRWNLQEQVFQRYTELRQQEPEMGTLEIRDNRTFFRSGKRREAVMMEKRFYEARYRETQDTQWFEKRLKEFEEPYKNFCMEEKKHKLAMVQAHLQKTSPFKKLPILCNRFLLVCLRGRGGNGEVWEVLDYQQGQRRVAIKLSTAQRYLREEHCTHVRLQHPHIVLVGGNAFAFEYRQQIYSAFMQECIKSDLQQELDLCDCLPEPTSLKMLYQLLTALLYLHEEQKIAHYDLKPSNILVCEDMTIKLTDFGLARHVDAQTATSTIGTLRYLPPECFRDRGDATVGTAEKADVWMVGVVYALMIWGKHPILGDRSAREDAKNLIGNFNGNVRIPKPTSEVSRKIIQSCLQLDPRQRPTTRELLQAMTQGV